MPDRNNVGKEKLGLIMVSEVSAHNGSKIHIMADNGAATGKDRREIQPSSMHFQMTLMACFPQSRPTVYQILNI